MITEEKIKTLKAGVDGLLDKISDKSEPFFNGQAVGLHYVKELIDNIFPELKESEDEKVRKTLPRCCDDWEKGQFGCMSKEDIPAIRAYLQKQKEQKTTEWSEEDKDYYDAIIAKLEITQDDAMLTDNQIDFLKSIPERFNLQPKQEWSEKDEEMRLACIDIIEHFPTPSGTVYGPWSDCINWLKSLRLQPKQEWSKEDENIYNKALDAIYYKDLNDKDEVVDSLKELCDLIARNRKVIPPYARWKPSEEQMEAFSQIVQQLKPDKELESLYNDLKKL